MNPLRSIITRILPKAWFSPYEAANHSPRRGRVNGGRKVRRVPVEK